MGMSKSEKEPPDPVDSNFVRGGLGCDTGQDFDNVLDSIEFEEDEMSTISEGDQQDDFQLVQSRNQRKKRKTRDTPDGPRIKQKRRDIKVVMKFQKPGLLNPLKVSAAIHKLVGDVFDVKPLRDGSLLIVCRDRDQRMGLMQCRNLLGINVKVQDWEERGNALIVITGVPTELSEEEIKQNIRGTRVIRVKRLLVTRAGIKTPSLSVLLTLQEPKQPERIMIGYVSYQTRPYVPPPTRCFKCQRYGHIALVCKAKCRCARCGGEHEYGKCEEGTKIKCCNCGGEHSAAYKGCEMHKKAVQVQNVKVKEQISYAEAIKRVNKENKARTAVNVGLHAAPMPAGVQMPQKCCKLTDDTLIVNKKNFVAFIAEVINRSALIESRTDKIKMIKKAAEKHLDIRGLTVLDIHNMLSEPLDPDFRLATPKCS